jgi:hypothetical protein
MTFSRTEPFPGVPPNIFCRHLGTVTVLNGSPLGSPFALPQDGLGLGEVG